MRVRHLCQAIAVLCHLATVTANAAGSGNPAKPAADLNVSLFAVHCGICHYEHGAGTLAIEHRLGRDHGLLEDRSDLVCDYVMRIVRTGFASMPPQTRVDLTDADLAVIAAYLSHDAPEHCVPSRSDHD